MSIYALIPLLPFTAFLINGLLGRKFLKDSSQWVSIAAVIASFLISVAAIIKVAGGEVIHVPLYNWIAYGEFNIGISLYIDHLSSVMLLIVTGVSTLVHIYSIGYMHGEAGYYRFFAYLSLFTFSMLMLVLSDNYFLLYVFWESVGLCSYLLIGFWFHKKSATDAGKKAFVANRVGDFGFGIGIMTLFTVFGTFNFYGPNGIFENAHLYVGNTFPILGFNVPIMTLVCLLLMVGALGKSAQLPLYVWLPDAMEGPTSCSALIHAATMVTAGVYMMVRSNALYVLSPEAMQVVAVIGCSTAIFAASIAIVQNDVKKVLAYSTISQLGYMVLAVGVGAFSGAIFHLMTHAFFKALLFLGAGSVIHAMSGEQDMRKMGGLLPHMKYTGYTCLAATLAIAGFPLLSGFFSKDQILGETYKGGHYILWAVGLTTAFMTAFYMFRWYFLTFLGKSRVEAHAAKHLHESPKTMTMPLVILAVLSVFAGLIFGLPLENGYIHRHLNHVMPTHHQVMQMQEGGHAANDINIVSTAYAAEGGGHSSDHSAEKATHGGAEHKEAVPPHSSGGHGAAESGGGHGAESAGSHGGGHGGGGGHFWLEVFLIGSSVLVGLIGIYIAYFLYLKRVDKDYQGRIAKKYKALHTTLLNKYYVDEIYDVLFINASKQLGYLMWRFDVVVVDGIPNGAAAFTKWIDQVLYQGDVHIIDGIVNGSATLTKWLSTSVHKYFDRGVVDYIVNFLAKFFVEGSMITYNFFDLPVIDGIVNGIANLIEFVGSQTRKLQTGHVQNYIFVFVFGLIVLVSIYLINMILAGAV